MPIGSAGLGLRLELLNEAVLADGKPWTVHDFNYYTAWVNSLSRILQKLGLKNPISIPKPPKPRPRPTRTARMPEDSRIRARSWRSSA